MTVQAASAEAAAAPARLDKASVDTSVPVVVLTTSTQQLLHTPLAIARSLGRLGARVFTAHPGAPLPYDHSRFVRGQFQVMYDRTDPAGFAEEMERIAARLGETAILIPIDDTAALYVDDHAGVLAQWFRFPHRPSGVAAALARKDSLHGLCRQYRVPTANVTVPGSRRDVTDYAEKAGFPVVAKLIDAGRCHDGVPSVTLARRLDDLLDVYERSSHSGRPNLLLQEYLPGGAESVWMFNGYFDASSRCRAGFTGTKLRQCPPGTGPTSLGVCKDNPLVARVATDLLTRVGYSGIVDLGCRFDERDGQYKLLDVNPRIGATFRLFVDGRGLDVVRALYLDLTGQPVPPAGAPEGRRWLDEPHDLYASLGSARTGRRRPGAWAASLRGVREGAWFAADDPSPFARMTAVAARTAVTLTRRDRRTRQPVRPTP